MNRIVLIAELGKDLARWVLWLSRLQKTEYWGSVTFKFEKGRIVSGRTEQTIRPEELDGG